MPTWQKVITAMILIGLCYFMYRGLRSNPEALSKANLGKSSRLMAVLALVLIAFVAVCVFFLRSSS